MNTQASNGQKSIRVLVVDDYPAMADDLAKALCDKEYAAIPVYSGEDALRVAEQFAPHALISDVTMPGMNGVELACAFAEKYPACCAVLMSANEWEKEILVGELRLKVFQKPLDHAELFNFLADAAR